MRFAILFISSATRCTFRISIVHGEHDAIVEELRNNSRRMRNEHWKYTAKQAVATMFSVPPYSIFKFMYDMYDLPIYTVSVLAARITFLVSPIPTTAEIDDDRVP